MAAPAVAAIVIGAIQAGISIYGAIKSKQDAKKRAAVLEESKKNAPGYGLLSESRTAIAENEQDLAKSSNLISAQIQRGRGEQKALAGRLGITTGEKYAGAVAADAAAVDAELKKEIMLGPERRSNVAQLIGLQGQEAQIMRAASEFNRSLQFRRETASQDIYEREQTAWGSGIAAGLTNVSSGLGYLSAYKNMPITTPDKAGTDVSYLIEGGTPMLNERAIKINADNYMKGNLAPKTGDTPGDVTDLVSIGVKRPPMVSVPPTEGLLPKIQQPVVMEGEATYNSMLRKGDIKGVEGAFDISYNPGYFKGKDKVLTAKIFENALKMGITVEGFSVTDKYKMWDRLSAKQQKDLINSFANSYSNQ